MWRYKSLLLLLLLSSLLLLLLLLLLSADFTEYCVSSSAELLEDVVPCMVVGTNSSGSVTIEGGFIIVRAGEQEERYNITDFQASREDKGQKKSEKAAKFNMEPGK